MTECMKKYMKRVLKAVWILLVAASVLVLMYYGSKVFVYDSFLVGGDSMEPTLHRGERVYVNKLILGPRIYRNYDFTRPDLQSFRLGGFGELHPGDIAVFNFPYARSHDTVSFRINYVYVKRCIGIPGDSVSVRGGYWHNSNSPGIIGPEGPQRILSMTPDSLLAGHGVVLEAFQSAKSLGWTIRDFGPYYVPGRGDRIDMTVENFRLYMRLILYETGFKPELLDGMVYLGGEPLESYTFRNDYYFFGGDNVLNSRDSRYIGLVPEDYVVGVVSRRP